MRELSVIAESPEVAEEVEAILRELFRQEIYAPLADTLGDDEALTVQNAPVDILERDIRKGRLTYDGRKFTGSFRAETSKALKKLGAKWAKDGWVVSRARLPDNLRSAIDTSDRKFQAMVDTLNERVRKILPEEIADRFDATGVIDRAIGTLDKRIEGTLKGLTVPPRLTEAQRKSIAKEYTQNMRLYIKDWAKSRIVELRKTVEQRTFRGDRYETLIKKISRDYGVSMNKAKFLAKQETRLFMAAVKKERYKDAGVPEYRWGCVAGSKLHPVRKMHRDLEGKIFSWDNPPVVNKDGDRKNPGEDYGCRCFAVPVVGKLK